MAIHEQEAERWHLLLPPEGEVRPPEDEEEEGLVVGGLVRRTLTESRKLWRVAGPSIFSRLAMFSLTVISLAFASHLGSLYLAALSIATTVIISFSFGFMVGECLLQICHHIVGTSAHFGNFPGQSIHLQYYFWLGINDSAGVFGCNGVGQCTNELGAGKAKAARFAVSVSVFNALIVGMIFWLVVIAFPDHLARIFTSSDSIVRVVTQLSTLLAFAILINCVQPVFSGLAVGCGWQALATIVNLGSYYVVGLPLGIVLGWLLPYGIKVTKAKNLAMEARGLSEGMIG